MIVLVKVDYKNGLRSFKFELTKGFSCLIAQLEKLFRLYTSSVFHFDAIVNNLKKHPMRKQIQTQKLTEQEEDEEKCSNENIQSFKRCFYLDDESDWILLDSDIEWERLVHDFTCASSSNKSDPVLRLSLRDEDINMDQLYFGSIFREVFIVNEDGLEDLDDLDDALDCKDEKTSSESISATTTSTNDSSKKLHDSGILFNFGYDSLYFDEN